MDLWQAAVSPAPADHLRPPDHVLPALTAVFAVRLRLALLAPLTPID